MSTFTFRRPNRRGAGLLIGLAGPSGGGKTLSALKLARGLAGEKPFAVIDTEAGRAQMYADDCQPWDWGDLTAPFTPERYDEAIAAADKAGYPVIVVDSFSHEHAGDGGLLDMHNQELDRMAGNDWKKREAATFAAWVRPKESHKRLIYHLLQLRAHLIICLRAEPKVEITRDERGKVQVVPKRSLTGLDGWIPVAEKNLAFELSVSLLVTPDAPGVPKPIKLPEMLRPYVPVDQRLSERTGAAIAAWANDGGDGDAGVPEPIATAPAGIVEALKAAKKEAGVSDAWMRAQLKKVGVADPPQKATLATIKSLTPAQAEGLLAALNSKIDERELF
jgi:hypothetical protein